eukprot:TRINITY_DN778_c0_g1::TRINITY_DN778_c0_g1_i1::g.18392::m.18392 TRINITY_DN778_c0_g1::TRINITY_DN778_c0_g1_i1::g.18392  ORF type:complete len:868 (+),score=361.39,sp/Q05BC3/EMAL1_MOUSE/34.07/6e-133,WD40/PF00400.27/0.14,WD40/PF00400.27/0.00013,WD40/PF00400.27/3.4,WD40/PF00400.27/1.3,WD40/PF00400.27/0.0074,WD40/PF00400.27/1.2e+03,WD40/PF00400.27/0.56,WD40/PF00400.27/0.00013,WD40/PF00400.27/0.003,WD40/PF00400.27/9.9e-06,HELP/PF03451.9/3.3e-16,HELP/PF03451.9/3.9e+03,Cytochrom_D1/PF02239.11/1.9e+02,Cytoc
MDPNNEDVVKQLREEISAIRLQVAEIKSTVEEHETQIKNGFAELKEMVQSAVLNVSASPRRTSTASTNGTSPKTVTTPRPATAAATASPRTKPTTAAPAAGATASKPVTSAPASTSAVRASATGSVKARLESRPSATSATKPSPTATKNKDGAVQYFIQGRRITVYAPTGYQEPADARQVPESKFDLEFVHGYRGRDSFNNLFWVGDDRIVYPTAALGVVYDIVANSQEFLKGNTDDVLCLAIHPDKKYVALGQVDPKGKDKAYFLIFDLETKQVVHKLGQTFHDHGINCLAFSHDGKLIASVGMDTDHSTAIWAWETEKLIASSKGGPDKVYGVAFNPTNGSVVTCGVKNTAFWALEDGNKLNKKKGIFGKKGEQQNIICIAFTPDGRTLTGTAKTGDIYIWEGNNLVDVLAGGHEKNTAVIALKTLADGTLISAGKDGKLVFWRPKENLYEVVFKVDVGIETRSLDVLVKGDILEVALGGANNSIKTVTVRKQGDSFTAETPKLIMESHSSEVWGLAPHPNGQSYLTAADDKDLREWSVAAHKVTRTVTLPEKTRCAHYSYDGKYVVVGHTNGAISVLDGSTLAVLSTRKDRKEEISDVKFEPQGYRIAVGSHDNFIDLYNVASGDAGLELKKYATCKGHTSFITHVDWSADGRFLQSNSGDYEILYWDAKTGKQVTDGSLGFRDMEWASFTCILGWPVNGIWPPDSDGTDINAVDHTPNKKLVATAGDDGTVRLFKSPAHEPGRNKMAPAHEGTGHSSHVTSVRFLPSSSHVISTGGNDCSVFQWKVTLAPSEADSNSLASSASSAKSVEVSSPSMPAVSPVASTTTTNTPVESSPAASTSSPSPAEPESANSAAVPEGNLIDA